MSNTSNHSCILELPYPKVATGGKNPKYAELLLQDYAGMNGELSAITKYFFQHTTIKERDPDLADSLECISRVEMHHLDILGELIFKFGEEPKFMAFSGRKWSYWNGGYISYDTNVRSFLRGNIEGEKAAIQNYGMRIKQIDDGQVRKILERIILDEEYHIRIFEEYLKKFADR